MKVWVVKEPTGAYEEYREDIIGVYSDYSIVEKLVEQQNDKIRKQQEKLEKCRNCKFNKIPEMFFEDITKPDCFKELKDYFSSEFKKDHYCNCQGLRQYTWQNEIIPYGDGFQNLVVEEYELNEGDL